MPKTIPPETRAAIRYLYIWGDGKAGQLPARSSPAEITAYCERNGIDVSKRSVERLTKPYRDDSPLWTLGDAVGDEAALLLPVVAELAQQQHRLPSLTARQAHWVLRVRRAAPDLPVWPAFNYALEYIRCENDQRPDHHVTAALAYRVWEPGDAVERFKADAAKWRLPEIILYGAPPEDQSRVLQELFGGAGIKPTPKRRRTSK